MAHSNSIQNPFSVSYPRDEDVMTPGASRLVEEFRRSDAEAAQADPLADEAKKLNAEKSRLGEMLSAHKVTREKFIKDFGGVLFAPGLDGQIKATEDGMPNSEMASQIEELRIRSVDKKAGIGAWVTGTTGAATNDAAEAQAELAKQEPRFKAISDRWQRIREQEQRIKDAHDSAVSRLGELSMLRLQRDGVLGTQPAATPGPQTPLPAGSADPLASPAPRTSGGTMTRNGITTVVPGAGQPPQPNLSQGSSVVERQAHNLDVVGSIPALAPNSQAAALPPAPGPTPLQLVQMHRRIKDNEAVMAMPTTSPELKEALRQRNERSNELFMKGMAALGSDGLRQRVIDYTRDPTLGEKVKNFTANIAEGAGTGLVDMGEFFARNAKYAPNLILPGITALTPDVIRQKQAEGDAKVAEFSQAMRDEAATWGMKGVPKEVADKLNDSFSGMLGQGIGSTLAFIAPTTGALRIGQALGYGPKVLKAIAMAVPGLAGGAAEGNSLRREAAVNLEAMVKAGELTPEEAQKGVNQAEFIGIMAGLTESISPLGAWSKKIVGIPVGQTLLKGMAEKFSTGGAKAVTQWLRGNGRRLLADVAEQAGEETFQELGQSYIENRAARGELGNVAFDPQRALGEGLMESAGVGGITGALITALLGGLSGADVKRQKRIAAAMQRGAEAGRARENQSEADANKKAFIASEIRKLGNEAEANTKTPPANRTKAQTDRYEEIVSQISGLRDQQQGQLRSSQAAKTLQGPAGGAGSAPNTGSGGETGSAPASTTNPIASADGKTVHQWTFTDATGKQESVTATGLKDAISKLPEGYKPDLTKIPTQETIASPADKATPDDLAGKLIDKEWTAFSTESQSLGIPRAEMPQVKAEARGALTQFLAARGITHTEEEVLPGSLKPTQAEFSQAKVDKARKFEGGDRAILVSEDGHVVDGHHQWMAKLTDEPNQPMRVIRLNAPVKDLLENVKEFPSVKAADGATATKPFSQPAPEASGSTRRLESVAKPPQTPPVPAGNLFTQPREKYSDLIARAKTAGLSLSETVLSSLQQGDAKIVGRLLKRVIALEKGTEKTEEARPPLAPPQSFRDTRTDLLAKIDAAMESAPAVAEENTGTTAIQSGNTKFTVTNSREVLQRLRQRVQRNIPANQVAGKDDGRPREQRAVKTDFETAKTETERRGYMDQMTNSTLQELGLDAKYERIGPGVVLTKQAAQALRDLKAGKKGKFDIEASTAAEDSTLDPTAPAALRFTDAAEGEIIEGSVQHVQEFAAALNSQRRRIGEAAITLTPQRLETAGGDPRVPGRSSGDQSRSADAQRFIRGIELSLRKRVVFVRPSAPVAWEALSSPSRANTIIVNVDAKNPVAALVGHELAHNVKAQNRDLWDRMDSIIQAVAGAPTDEYRAAKAAQGYKTAAQQNDEWTADVLGQRFDEPEFWQAVERTSTAQGKEQTFREFARSAWEWLTNFARRVRRVFTRGSDQGSIRRIDDLRRSLAEVLMDYQAQMPAAGYAENPAAGDTSFGIEANTPIVRGTPEQEQIIAKVTGTLEDKRTLIQRVGDYLADLGDYIQRELQQKLLDRFTAIKRLERATIGTNELDASISAYKWSRLTGNLAGVMQYLMRHGQIAYRNGSMEMVPGTKGIVDILRPVVEGGKLRLWEGYVAAYRANRLLAEGKEHNFGKYLDPQTGEWAWSAARAQEEIDALLALGSQHPEFEEVRQAYVAFQKSVLDLATSAGLIDPRKRAMWERSDYVPFYRIVEALDGKEEPRGPRRRRGFSGQSANVRQLTGAPQQVAILENIFRNIEQLVDASFKNVAMQRITDLADEDTDLLERIPFKAVPFKASTEEVVKQLAEAGIDVGALSKDELQEVISFWRTRAPEGSSVVVVMHQGNPVYYRVNDPLLLRSILAMGPDRHSWWMKMLMVPKHALTTFVTLDPAFMAANTIRDSFSAWVIADTPIKPGWDAMRGFAKALANDPAKLAIMASGGGTGHYNTVTESQVRAEFLRMTREDREGFLNSIIDTPAKLARLYRSIGQATENANRIAIADSARKGGASTAEAAFQALDIMDFGLRGDSKALAFFLDTVPFMNARIQGLYRLGRGLMNDPKRVATHGAMIMGATLALLATNWDDDRYWSLQEWDRDQYYHLWLGSRHIRIPKPFEVGQIFSTIPERFMQFMAKDGDGRLFARRMLSMIGDTFAMWPIPQAGRPLLERALNKNLFTGARIISKGDEYKTPEMQYSAFTSLTARELANAMPDGAPEWLRSPKTLDSLIRGYFGTLGMYAVDAADAVIRPAGGYPVDPETKLGDYWMIRRFSPESDLRETKFVGEFYELHQDIQQITATVKALRKSGEHAKANQTVKENRALLSYAPTAESTDKVLTALRQRERQIYEDRTMSAARKREELSRLNERINRLARQGVSRAPGRTKPVIRNPFR